MTWLAWRQTRAQLAVAFGVLVLLAVFAARTGLHLSHLYSSSGIGACRAANGDCVQLTDNFLAHTHALRMLGTFLIGVPGLIGIFWGAPLVARELENGTHRLAWTQSISRGRWLAVKLAVMGLASVVVTGLLSLVVSWSSRSIDQVTQDRFSPAWFDQRGIVPLGYAAFAFAIGVTAGLLIRRTLPAMAAALVAVVGSRMALTYWVRPHLATPIKLTSLLQFRPGLDPGARPGDWVLSNYTIDQAGRVLGRDGGFAVPASCPGPRAPGRAPNDNAVQSCLSQLHIRQVVTYQPGSRYWAFQTWETLICFGLALLLAAFCFWWVRHRTS